MSPVVFAVNDRQPICVTGTIINNQSEMQMKKVIIALGATAIAATSLIAAFPAEAASAPAPQVLQVADHHHYRKPDFQMRNHYAYLNGHRGDHRYHSGWRQYNGWYFPPDAFVGMFIGGVLGTIISHAH